MIIALQFVRNTKYPLSLQFGRHCWLGTRPQDPLTPCTREVGHRRSSLKGLAVLYPNILTKGWQEGKSVGGKGAQAEATRVGRGWTSRSKLPGLPQHLNRVTGWLNQCHAALRSYFVHAKGALTTYFFWKKNWSYGIFSSFELSSRIKGNKKAQSTSLYVSWEWNTTEESLIFLIKRWGKMNFSQYSSSSFFLNAPGYNKRKTLYFTDASLFNWVCLTQSTFSRCRGSVKTFDFKQRYVAFLP